jgi:hypothetical protein
VRGEGIGTKSERPPRYRGGQASRLLRFLARAPDWKRPQGESNPSPPPVRIVADRRENDAENATPDDSRRRGVSASPATTDEAIRLAAKVAIDTGEYERARALIDLIERPPREARAEVVPMVPSARDRGTR